MRIYERVFIDLIKASLWGEEPNVPLDFDQWDKVAALANGQSVFAVVGKVLLTDESLKQRLSTDLRLKLKKLTFSHINSHTFLNKTLGKAVSVLRENGIEPILLKGQALACNYPEPNLRQCGDIDLYVGCENSIKAYEALEPHATSIEDKSLADHGKHYDVVMDMGVKVEVHRYTDLPALPRLRKIYQEASDRGVSEDIVMMDISGIQVSTPSDDFNAFYIFNHLFHHFLTSGIGLRQFCDWMMFLHVRGKNINLDYLKKLINDMNLMEPWQAFGCVLVKELGLPKDEFPFYDESKEVMVGSILKRVLYEGNFGKERTLYKKRGSMTIVNKLLTLISYVSRSFSFLFLFPKQTLQHFLTPIMKTIDLLGARFSLKFKS